MITGGIKMYKNHLKKHQFLILIFSIVVFSQLIQIAPKIYCPGFNLIKCEASIKVKIREVASSSKVKKSGVVPYLEIGAIIAITATWFISMVYISTRDKTMYYERRTKKCYDKYVREVKCPEWIRKAGEK